MNQASRQLLTKLLNHWQRNPNVDQTARLPITTTRAPVYFNTALAEEKEALHSGLQEAEDAGAVKLEWGKRFESHLLKRITLVDGVKLARYLAIPLAAQQAADARSELVGEVSGREAWIGEFVESLLKLWRCNKPVAGIQPGDITTARLLVNALEAVSAGRHRNLDLRTFSVREFADSKAMEGILSRFAMVWKRYHPSDLSNEELFDMLGLVKFPLPLLLRGPIILRLLGRELDCGNILPYVGLPPQSILGLHDRKNLEFVLTIENLASFNRYTAEVADNGLIIYTGGFPSPGLANFLQLIDRSLSPSVPFFHWGDIDEGGLKIFAYIQELLQMRLLHAHQMDPGLLSLAGRTNENVRATEIRKIAQRHPVIEHFAHAILSTTPPKTLEQENVNPGKPVILCDKV